MKRKFKDMEKIEKYLDNQVDEQERAEVNNRLVSDEEFRRLFDEMESLLEGIKHTGAKTTVEEKLRNLEETLHIMEKIEEEETKFEPEQVSQPVIVLWYNMPVYRAVAASFILLIAAVYVFGPFGSMSDDRLFAEYFEPRANYERVRGETSMDQRQEAYIAYDREDYETATTLLKQILPETEYKNTDMIYLGNAYLALGEGEKAIKFFKEVAEMKAGYALEAKWYLALSYLQVGERENARKEFREIAEADSDYAEEAGRILGKMRKNKEVLMNLIQLSN